MRSRAFMTATKKAYKLHLAATPDARFGTRSVSHPFETATRSPVLDQKAILERAIADGAIAPMNFAAVAIRSLIAFSVLAVCATFWVTVLQQLGR